MKKVFTLICIAAVASLTVISCKKSSTTSTPASTSSTTGSTTGGVTVNSTPQVTYSMGGTNYSYISNNNTIFSGSSTDKTLNTSGPPSTDIFIADIDDGSNIVYLAIKKGTVSFTGSSSPDSTTFKNYFTTGSKSYSVNAANGIEITMTDATGTTWSTSTGSQTGSTFSIDAIKETWSFGTQYMKVKISFSCKLYDPSGSNPKTITNGVFVGEFGNI